MMHACMNVRGMSVTPTYLSNSPEVVNDDGCCCCGGGKVTRHPECYFSKLNCFFSSLPRINTNTNEVVITSPCEEEKKRALIAVAGELKNYLW